MLLRVAHVMWNEHRGHKNKQSKPNAFVYTHNSICNGGTSDHAYSVDKRVLEHKALGQRAQTVSARPETDVATGLFV